MAPHIAQTNKKAPDRDERGLTADNYTILGAIQALTASPIALKPTIKNLTQHFNSSDLFNSTLIRGYVVHLQSLGFVESTNKKMHSAGTGLGQRFQLTAAGQEALKQHQESLNAAQSSLSKPRHG